MTDRRSFCLSLAAAPLLAARATAAAPGGGAAIPAADAFRDPPDAARPRVLWMWMGCNISRTGITRDLEAMSEGGIGGVTLMPLSDVVTPDPGAIIGSPTPELIAFTPPWFAMLRHAAEEAKRLGLTMAISNCPGYSSSGGPWITAEHSMQQLIWSATDVAGGERFRGVVEREVPDTKVKGSFPLVWLPEEGRVGWKRLPERATFYRDVALLAVPRAGVIAPSRIVDLSSRMTPDGTLDWQAPPGDWTLYRFGRTTMGAFTMPAQWQAFALEVDKLNPEALDHHVASLSGLLREHLGALAGTVLDTLHFDSYEAGDTGWTAHMPEEYGKRRRRPLAPWLPVLAGRTVESVEATSAFRDDFRQVIQEMFEDIYWPQLGKAVRKAGFTLSAEPYDGQWRPEAVVKDIDLVMSEFWPTKGYAPMHVAALAEAGRGAGKPIAAAEAFTSNPEEPNTLWRETPGRLKLAGDQAFCDGVNLMSIHMWAHQPWDDHVQPGMTMGQWGVHLGRNQTWWEPGKHWLRYLWRTQYMMRRGVPAAPPAGVKQARDMRVLAKEDGDTAFCFVVNCSSDFPATAELVFDGVDRQPELWNPIDGAIRDLPEFRFEDGKTIVPMLFAPSQSWFVVRRRPVAGDGRGQNFPRRSAIATLDRPWRVTFDPQRRGPGAIVFPHLEDWTTRPEEGVRHYSGTAVYETDFVLPAGADPARLFLDLGIVRHFAQVSLNGRDLGVLWTAPWTAPLATARAGRNTLTIAVTNCWANRIAGDDALYPDDCEWGERTGWWWRTGRPLKALPRWVWAGGARPEPRRSTFATWTYLPDKPLPLDPSGLIGPVRILMEDA